MTPVLRDLARIRLERGVGSRTHVEAEWIVEGPGPYTVRFESQKGGQHSRFSK